MPAASIILNLRGLPFPRLNPILDLLVSIGVNHLFPIRILSMRALSPPSAVRGGAALLIWLYGREGKSLYLSIFEPLHAHRAAKPAFSAGSRSA